MNKLYICRHEAKTEEGFLSRNLGKMMKERVQIEHIPDFAALNQPNDLSDKENKYEDIDTVIQYLPIDDCEYHSSYKNIIIYNPPHFITKNKSVADKLAIFDEIWLFDENSRVFLDGNNLEDKIKIIGYPYIDQDVLDIFRQTNLSNSDNIVTFYTIIDDYQLENIESLVSNFIVTFSRVGDAKLIVYINTKPENQEELQKKIKEIMFEIRKNLKFTSNNLIDSNITILVGDVWADDETFAKINNIGDCYINLDYKINPYILVAFTLKKYCVSICDFKKLLYFNKSCTIQTYKTSFRNTLNDIRYKHFFNEYNLFPKILDESIKNIFISSYNNIKNKENYSICFNSFSTDGYFNDKSF